MNNNELRVFKEALPDYVQHIRKNPNSLIARIYGVFTVLMEDLVPVHLLLMSNSAQVGKDYELCFDLKGSIINRKVPEHEIKPKGTLKDVNLLDMKKDKKSDHFLLFRQKDRLKLFLLIQVDILFLCKHNLMDYSLLLFVELNPNYVQPQIQRKLTSIERQRNTTLKSKDSDTNPSLQKPSISSEGGVESPEKAIDFFVLQ
jgi:1-phosphatidylinositol-4-phosphate 5-kinase